MVRAAVADHPKLWPFCGYNEIQEPPCRYRIIDLDNLVRLLGFTDLHDLQLADKKWIEASLQVDKPEREGHWTESIACGSKSFFQEVKSSLGSRAKGKSVTEIKGHYQLREDVFEFGNPSLKGFEPVKPVAGSDGETTNAFLWQDIS